MSKPRLRVFGPAVATRLISPLGRIKHFEEKMSDPELIQCSDNGAGGGKNKK